MAGESNEITISSHSPGQNTRSLRHIQNGKDAVFMGYFETFFDREYCPEYVRGMGHDK
jgi:hypothetical protein